MSEEFASIDADIQHDRERIIDLIRDIQSAESTAKPMTRAIDAMKAQLKQWMLFSINLLDRDENNKPIIWHPDLSTGYVLTEINGRESDIVSMAKNIPSQVIDMALSGALKPDYKVVDAHPGALWKEDLKKYTFDVGKTTRMDKKGN